MIRLHAGDCREILKTLDADSVDACVTDPPYELDFMGKAWDRSGVAFDPATWREVFRVLKPGAHLLAFGGTRTHHRLIVAIEDAGFEIRDCLGWLYGSGFPKSLDLAKAFDKARRDDVRHVCRFLRAAMDARGIKSSELAIAFDCHSRLIDHWAARDTDSQPNVATVEQWRKLKTLVGFGDEMDAEVERLNARKGEPGDDWKGAPVLGEHAGDTPGLHGERFETRDRTIRAANSDLAQAWAGWGTALKPAWEPVCMARKPFRGTVAENVARHGVGAVNIDGCRIATCEPATDAPKKPLVASNEGAGSTNFAMTSGNTHPAGRWPANILHDGSEEVVALFPNDAGAAAPVHTRNGDKFRNLFGDFPGNVDEGGSTFHGDAGSAARFFYCAKTSPAERDDGLAHLDPVAFARSTGAQTAVAAGAEYQTETGGGYNRVQRVRNTHPTVKPTDLMAYLCRLVTPPGGTVLDPFCGSGSTGRGAVREQFHFVGIDLDPQNIAIAEARIHAAAPLFARAAE